MILNLPLNKNKPRILHVDLNSCFATILQQANPLLRGKPIVVSAYTTPNGCVLAPSIESKRYGIKTAMTNRMAKQLCPQVEIFDNDPVMVRDVHVKLKKICNDYTPAVKPKSIDELVLDFTDEYYLRRDLTEIAAEMKARIRKEIGEWMTCSIGISTNRFLAKLAAGLKKPDGLVTIDHTNLLEVYKRVSLIDLNGVGTKFQARLKAAGIFTPMQFLNASEDLLHKQVFQSINGYYWYQRLRGFEVDAVDFARKSYGQSYALKQATSDQEKLAQMVYKLCEKLGRRMRSAGYSAYGVHVSCLYIDGTHWHRGRQVDTELITTNDIYRKMWYILDQQPEKKMITNIAVTCYDLLASGGSQQSLFEMAPERKRNLSRTLDVINDKYGEFTIRPALMLGMGTDIIMDRIAFGQSKELEDLYSN